MTINTDQVIRSERGLFPASDRRRSTSLPRRGDVSRRRGRELIHRTLIHHQPGEAASIQFAVVMTLSGKHAGGYRSMPASCGRRPRLPPRSLTKCVLDRRRESARLGSAPKFSSRARGGPRQHASGRGADRHSAKQTDPKGRSRSNGLQPFCTGYPTSCGSTPHKACG